VEQLVAAEHDTHTDAHGCAPHPASLNCYMRSSMMDAWAEHDIRPQGQRDQRSMVLDGPAPILPIPGLSLPEVVSGALILDVVLLPQPDSPRSRRAPPG
jgi:hypothetical protein